jgi:hypothetical protein
MVAVPRGISYWLSPALAMAATLFCATPIVAAQQHLYILDFGSPPHVVGQRPTIGGGPAPRNTVSYRAGTPVVVDSYAVLPDQPLRFGLANSPGNLIQLQIDDLPPCDRYTFEADVAVAAMTETPGAFTIFIDVPTIRTIRFYRTFSGRTIRVAAPGTDTQIGTFEYGQKINLRVDVDLTADDWQVFLDDTLAHAGPFGGATAISTVRVADSTGNIDAYIDNVLISGADCADGVTPGTPRKLKIGGYDLELEVLELRHIPGCAASTHNLVYGPLAAVSSYGYTGQVCDLGISRDLSIALGPDSYFFLLVASDGAYEGSYGADAIGTERPAYTDAPDCPLLQDLTQRCD